MVMNRIQTQNVDNSRFLRIFKTLYVDFQNSDRTMQKKAYTLLEELCSGLSEDSQSFVQTHIDDIQTCLTSTLSTANESSKRVFNI